MKYCNGCKKEKPVSEFYANKVKKDGLQTQCKECSSLRAKKRYESAEYRSSIRQRNKEQRKKLRRWLDSLKQDPCVDCGIKYPPYVMDFDHRDPSQKEIAISRAIMIGFSKERILQEIAKCDLICANCHRERTWGPQESVSE